MCSLVLSSQCQFLRRPGSALLQDLPPFTHPRNPLCGAKVAPLRTTSSLLGAFSEARRHLVERQWEGLPVSDRRPCVVSMRPAAPNVCAANGFSAAAEPWPYDAVNRGAQKGERTRAKEDAEGLRLLAAPLVRGCNACQPANFSCCAAAITILQGSSLAVMVTNHSVHAVNSDTAHADIIHHVVQVWRTQSYTVAHFV